MTLMEREERTESAFNARTWESEVKEAEEEILSELAPLPAEEEEEEKRLPGIGIGFGSGDEAGEDAIKCHPVEAV